eukprot:Polyplicarium_translucidae@DN3223_c0_g3_i2.p1
MCLQYSSSSSGTPPARVRSMSINAPQSGELPHHFGAVTRDGHHGAATRVRVGGQRDSSAVDDHRSPHESHQTLTEGPSPAVGPSGVDPSVGPRQAAPSTGPCLRKKPRPQRPRIMEGPIMPWSARANPPHPQPRVKLLKLSDVPDNADMTVRCFSTGRRFRLVECTRFWNAEGNNEYATSMAASRWPDCPERGSEAVASHKEPPFSSDDEPSDDEPSNAHTATPPVARPAVPCTVRTKPAFEAGQDPPVDLEQLSRLMRMTPMATLSAVPEEKAADDFFLAAERKLRSRDVPLEGEALDCWLEVDYPGLSYEEVRDNLLRFCFPQSLLFEELRKRLTNGREMAAAEARVARRLGRSSVLHDREFKRSLLDRLPRPLRDSLKGPALDLPTSYLAFRNQVRYEASIEALLDDERNVNMVSTRSGATYEAPPAAEIEPKKHAERMDTEETGAAHPCDSCGSTSHSRNACPVFQRNMQCFHCKRTGHLQAVCRSRARGLRVDVTAQPMSRSDSVREEIRSLQERMDTLQRKLPLDSAEVQRVGLRTRVVASVPFERLRRQDASLELRPATVRPLAADDRPHRPQYHPHDDLCSRDGGRPPPHLPRGRPRPRRNHRGMPPG